MNSFVAIPLRSIVRCAVSFSHGNRRRGWYLVAVLLASGGGAGCQQPPAPPSPPSPPVVVPVTPPVSNEPNAAAQRLLERAEGQIAKHQLTTPPTDNALASYAEVLKLDNGPAAQAQVRLGRERIIDAYLGLAESALTNNISNATTVALVYIDQAAAIDADHPGIPAMRQRLALITSAPRARVPLDGQVLRARAPALVQQLQKIGAEAKAKRAFVTIFARSDEEGRWIYRQLSSAAGDVRLRAEIRRSATPILQLTYLERTCHAC